MPREPLNIEDLLERLGSIEPPGDATHRYELRRALLCSRFFATECRQSRWNRLLSYTAPLVAGGVMVGVFSLLAVSDPGEQGTPQPVSMETKVAEFSSPPDEPLVRLADFHELVPPEVVNFVPLADHQFVFMQ